MSLRTQIDNLFQGKLFVRPLFYSYPLSLRFKLSEGGSSIDMFLRSMQKAQAIIQDIFPEDSNITVCLRFLNYSKQNELREIVKQLHNIDLEIPHERDIWAEPVHQNEIAYEHVESYWVNIAFDTSSSQMSKLLWCALATDIGQIEPRLNGIIYLINLESEMAVFPYDDRGMDVIGNKFKPMQSIYLKHNKYLLDYDRDVMNEQFKKL